MLTVILEAIVSHDLWFWHAFFGMVGSNNDQNVLGASLLFNDILQGKAPNMSYVVMDMNTIIDITLVMGYISRVRYFCQIIHISGR